MGNTGCMAAAEFLAEQHVATIATMNEGRIWAATVFYASDKWRLIFVSSPSSRHSQNVERNKNVAVTIHNNAQAWHLIRGLQISGSCRELKNREIAASKEIYQRKFPWVGGGVSDNGNEQESSDRGENRMIAAAMDRARWYEIDPTEIFYTDNSIHFSCRQRIFLR